MLTTVLHYSTIDFRFLQTNLEQSSKFSDEIIIPICTKFFNGGNENSKLLERSIEIINQYPKCKVFTFEWDAKYKNTTRYYHNLSRALGTEKASNEWILFLDCDEIVEDEFGEWFQSIKNTDNSYWLTAYWYFREPIYQATKTEAAGLLIKKKYCNWNLYGMERQQLFNNKFVNGERTIILRENGTPFVHHYSCVINKEEMLLKVNNWGHNNDRNWNKSVEEEFTHEFNGIDFVHGYSYNIVENRFNL